MVLDVDQIEAVTFDSFSTIVDVDSTAVAVEDYVDEPVAFTREWHSRAVNYGMVANHIDAYETYYDLHRDALAYLLAAEGVSLTEDELDETLAVYHEMDPFDDVREGMERLYEVGYTLGIVSNGNPSMLDSMIRVADIDELISRTVSADEIECYKPARELYEHAADRLDVGPSAIAHVSNGYSDVQGAMYAGMKGIWINRQNRPPDPFGPDPDLAIESMDGLRALLR